MRGEAFDHAHEAVCRACGVVAWAPLGDGQAEAVAFRAWRHRAETGHDVDVFHDDPDWPGPVLVESNGVAVRGWLAP